MGNRGSYRIFIGSVNAYETCLRVAQLLHLAGALRRAKPQMSEH